jgi:hypothetical protein
MRPDKKSITDEVWDNDRVRSFLSPRTPQGGDHPDFLILLNAYRGMRVDDFVRFLRFYCDERHDLDARNEAGQRFIEVIVRHRHGKPFADAMIAAGALPAENTGP